MRLLKSKMQWLPRRRFRLRESLHKQNKSLADSIKTQQSKVNQDEEKPPAKKSKSVPQNKKGKKLD